MVHTHHSNGDESSLAEFWQLIAEKIRQTESGVQGCYEVELVGEDVTASYPVADCWQGNVDSTEGMALVFPTEKTNPTPVSDSIVGANVGQFSFTAGVAKRDASEGLLTVWLSDPDLEQLTLPAGTPTEQHAECLGA